MINTPTGFSILTLKIEQGCLMVIGLSSILDAEEKARQNLLVQY